MRLVVGRRAMTERLDALAAFLRPLAAAMHISGMPAHELERRLNAIGERLGVRIESFAVLTMLTLNIVAADGTQRVEMIRLPTYDYNMARLIALDALIDELDSIDQLERYRQRLERIMAEPPLWRGVPFVLFGFLLSSSVAVLLRGGWVEALCGGLVGMVFVATYLAFARVPRLGPAAPVILCLLAALCAQALSLLFPGQATCRWMTLKSRRFSERVPASTTWMTTSRLTRHHKSKSQSARQPTGSMPHVMLRLVWLGTRVGHRQAMPNGCDSILGSGQLPMLSCEK